MALQQDDIVEIAAVLLKDPSYTTWLKANLESILQCIVLPEVEKELPLKNKTALGLTQYTKNIDISGLTNLTEIFKVEYPPDYQPMRQRNWDYLDDSADIIKLDMESEPTDTDETLTGTVTFTNASRTITGVGTTFLTELNENDFIRRAAVTKLYRIAHISSATSLLLERAFAETTGTDTANLTVMRKRSTVAYVYWGSKYTISDSATNAPELLDDILVAGVVNYALQQTAITTINNVNLGETAAQFYASLLKEKMKAYKTALGGLRPVDDDIAQWFSK